MPGLVIMDLNGGDAAICVVDDALWDQIVKINNDVGDLDKVYNDIGWLICNQSDTDRHDGAPDREGNILNTYYTQTWSIEIVNITSIRGILMLPCM